MQTYNEKQPDILKYSVVLILNKNNYDYTSTF